MRLYENEELFEELNQAVQWAGTLSVIYANVIAHRFGLSATEFEAMDLITRFCPITAGKLAEYCGLTSGAITGIVDRLERQGFVRRERDPEDRRRVFIIPTKDKERSKKIRALHRPIRKGFKEYVERYDEDQIYMLIKMQKEANAMVERSIAQLRQKD